MLVPQVAIASRFASSVVIAFPVDPTALDGVVSDRFSIELYEGVAYVAVAVVDQRDTRPKRLPGLVGAQMDLIEYLVFVRYRSVVTGRLLKGFVLLASETNSCLGARLAHWFTPYRLKRIDLRQQVGVNEVLVDSKAVGLHLRARRVVQPQLAIERFGDVARPRSFNFADLGQKGVVINRGILKGWYPEVLELDEVQVPLFDELALPNLGKPIAMLATDVNYVFKHHRTEQTDE